MGRKVLVIEDYEYVLRYVEVVLQREGIEVIGARNGRHGIELARVHMPDLVVSNFYMPEADGLQVLEALKSDPRTAGIPFIFMSSDASRSLRQRCVAMKADVFLAKPFSPDELMEAVCEALMEAEGERML